MLNGTTIHKLEGNPVILSLMNKDLLLYSRNTPGLENVSSLTLYSTFWPQHEISNNVVCATSKASDQPAHTRSLIRAFASRLSIL